MCVSGVAAEHRFLDTLEEEFLIMEEGFGPGRIVGQFLVILVMKQSTDRLPMQMAQYRFDPHTWGGGLDKPL